MLVNFEKIMHQKHYKEPNLIHPDMETKHFMYHFRQQYATKSYFYGRSKAESIVC
jgi:hypothetical protein